MNQRRPSEGATEETNKQKYCDTQRKARICILGDGDVLSFEVAVGADAGSFGRDDD